MDSKMLDGFWQNFFYKKILTRGKDYYKRGKVKDIKLCENYALAKVDGSGGEEYGVFIAEDKDDLSLDMYCTCPHYASGYNCKHLAAVLYKLENSTKKELNSFRINSNVSATKATKEKVIVKSNSNFDIQDTAVQLINLLNEEELKKTLLGYLSENSDLAYYIIDKIPFVVSSFSETVIDEVDEFFNRINTILEFFRQSRRVINETDGGDWFGTSYSGDRMLDESMLKQLTDEAKSLKSLLERNEVYFNSQNGLDDLLSLTYYFYDKADKEWSHLLEYFSIKKLSPVKQMRLFWEEWFKKQKKEDQENIIEHFKDDFIKVSDNSEDNFFYNFLSTFISGIIPKWEYNKLFLDQIDFQFKLAVNLGDDKKLEDLLAQRLDLMKKFGYSKKEIEDYKKTFPFLLSNQIIEIEKLLKSGEIQEAINKIISAREAHGKDPSVKSSLTELLIEIYEKLDFKEALKEEIISYYLGEDAAPIKIEYFYWAKPLLSQEAWVALGEEVSRNPGISWNGGEQLKFYASLNRKDEIFRLLTQGYALFNFFPEYEALIRTDYTDEFSQYLIKWIQGELYSYNRNLDHLVQYIKCLRNYPGGINYIYGIIDDLRSEKSPNQKLLDRLEKEGF